MTWNFRIIDHGDWLGLHEVLYDEAGVPRSYTAEPVTFVCDKVEGARGIAGSLEMALAGARDRAVLPVGVFCFSGGVSS